MRCCAAVLGTVIALGGCGGSHASAPPPAHWQRALHVPGIVDLTPPRSDGRQVIVAARRLALLAAARLRPFARGVHGYLTAPRTDEPYLALAGGCFRPDDVFVLAPGAHPGIVRVDRAGRAGPFARLPAGSFPDGIVFDSSGRFGRRLLITATRGAAATLLAVDCHASVATIARHVPKVEGGLAVAPASFGRYGGDLIAPNENDGRVYAIDARGRTHVLVSPGLASGGDIGVESAGFVPSRHATAYVADRGTPGNPHPGTDSLLALAPAALAAAGVAPGDLLVASEGGAQTIAVRCAAICRVRHVADGPTVAHVEGHIAFAG